MSLIEAIPMVEWVRPHGEQRDITIPATVEAKQVRDTVAPVFEYSCEYLGGSYVVYISDNKNEIDVAMQIFSSAPGQPLHENISKFIAAYPLERLIELRDKQLEAMQADDIDDEDEEE